MSQMYSWEKMRDVIAALNDKLAFDLRQKKLFFLIRYRKEIVYMSMRLKYKARRDEARGKNLINLNRF
jgi:hypothetical protein